MSKEKQIEEMAKHLIEIQQNFNEYCAKPCRECELGGVVNCESHYKATALYNADYRKQEWIIVEDRLPEKKVNCLVHYKHVYCDNDGYWAIGVSFYDGNEFHIGLAYKVTHWMPLPEAPKMKGGAEK